MAETDATRSLLLSALGFRENRVEDRAAARRGRLESERVRQEPGVDFQFDRQRRSIDTGREDQGLYRSGLTQTLQAENEFARNMARSDFESAFSNAQFDVWDATQQMLDDIEMQRAQGQIDFFERDLLRQLQNNPNWTPGSLEPQPPESTVSLGDLYEQRRKAAETAPKPRTTPRTATLGYQFPEGTLTLG